MASSSTRVATSRGLRSPRRGAMIGASSPRRCACGASPWRRRPSPSPSTRTRAMRSATRAPSRVTTSVTRPARGFGDTSSATRCLATYGARRPSFTARSTTHGSPLVWDTLRMGTRGGCTTCATSRRGGRRRSAPPATPPMWSTATLRALTALPIVGRPPYRRGGRARRPSTPIGGARCVACASPLPPSSKQPGSREDGRIGSRG
jgi:hypothetical protein